MRILQYRIILDDDEAGIRGVGQEEVGEDRLIHGEETMLPLDPSTRVGIFPPIGSSSIFLNGHHRIRRTARRFRHRRR